MGQIPVAKFLQGEKVYLRMLEPEDVEAFYEGVNNEPESRRLTGTQRAFTRQNLADYISNISQDDSRVQFAICLQENDQFIGDIALNNIERNNRSANFRIAIFAEEHAGKGYGSEATRLMLDHGFGVLNLHRIELDVYSINPRAIRAYEKVGFKKEGVKRENWYYNHQYYDSIAMSILEDEYRALYLDPK